MTNAPCNSSERRRYWLEARLGRLQKKGDWQAGYTRIFIEEINHQNESCVTLTEQHQLDSYAEMWLALRNEIVRGLNLWEHRIPDGLVVSVLLQSLKLAFRIV
jgi:hypothetical protein